MSEMNKFGPVRVDLKLQDTSWPVEVSGYAGVDYNGRLDIRITSIKGVSPRETIVLPAATIKSEVLDAVTKHLRTNSYIVYDPAYMNAQPAQKETP